MKHVLVIHYSQSGQLTEIIDNITAPLIASDDIEVTHFKIEMETPYPFPWDKKKFLDVFPESFLQIPQKIKPVPDEIIAKKYDLILLGHQVWYLSPSIPLNSFLQSEAAKKILNNTPVVTIIGCRNMWIQSQEKVKKLLSACNAKLVGNIALVDRHINHISVLTITHWMFTGKKSRFLGFFPKPGVSEKDINDAVKFASPIQKAILTNNYTPLKDDLLKLGAVKIKPFLVLADKRANILFSKWASFIYKKGKNNTAKRKKLLTIFKYYLLFAIWIIAPLVFIVFLATYFFGVSKKQT